MKLKTIKKTVNISITLGVILIVSSIIGITISYKMDIKAIYVSSVIFLLLGILSVLIASVVSNVKYKKEKDDYVEGI